jgi:hypothetical protein
MSSADRSERCTHCTDPATFGISLAPVLTVLEACVPVSNTVSQSHFTADSQSVSLGVEPTLWTFDHILLSLQEFGSGICCPVSVGAPSLTRGQVCPL